MPIDRATALTWWQYLDRVAHELENDNAHRPNLQSRYPTNPRHTAECIKGEAMLCSEDVDRHCRAFSHTRIWPDDLPAEQLGTVQHRLCCAKMVLEYMTTFRGGNADFLQSHIPDPEDQTCLLDWLLIFVWRALGDIYLEDQAKQLQALLTPGELQRLWEENPPLKG